MRERKTLKETDREDKKERKKRKRKERLQELLLLDLSLAPIVLIGNCTPVVHTLSLSLTGFAACMKSISFSFLLNADGEKKRFAVGEERDSFIIRIE